MMTLKTCWHASQRLVPQRDGGLIAEFRLNNTEELRSWVLGFGSHATVLEPDGLRAPVFGLATDVPSRSCGRILATVNATNDETLNCSSRLHRVSVARKSEWVSCIESSALTVSPSRDREMSRFLRASGDYGLDAEICTGGNDAECGDPQSRLKTCSCSQRRASQTDAARRSRMASNRLRIGPYFARNREGGRSSGHSPSRPAHSSNR
jgi:WYL domain